MGHETEKEFLKTYRGIVMKMQQTGQIKIYMTQLQRSSEEVYSPKYIIL